MYRQHVSSVVILIPRTATKMQVALQLSASHLALEGFSRVGKASWPRISAAMRLHVIDLNWVGVKMCFQPTGYIGYSGIAGEHLQRQ